MKRKTFLASKKFNMLKKVFDVSKDFWKGYESGN